MNLHSTLLCIPVLVFASPLASAQTGGGTELLYRYEGTASNTYFGRNCGFLGDVNGDGFDDFFIGNSSAAVNGVPGSGEAWIRSGVDGSVLHYVYGTQNSEWIGNVVELAGDVNGDGCDDFLLERRNLSMDLISGATGTLLHQWPMPLGDFLLVKAVDDLNGDGFDDLAFSTPYEGIVGLEERGTTTIYSGSNFSVLFTFTGTSAWEWLGLSVDRFDDYDGDGLPDILLCSAREITVRSGVTGAVLNQALFPQLEGFPKALNAGDLNQDGMSDILLSDPRASNGSSSDAGTVWAISGADQSLLHRINSFLEPEWYGEVLGPAGDVNGDGYDDFLAGSAFHLAGRDKRVELFSGRDGAMLQQWWTPFDSSFSAFDANANTNGGDSREFILGRDQADIGNLVDAGFVEVFSFHPYLRTDATHVSSTSGGTVNLGLDFPSSAAGYQYRILMSQTGNGPTTFGIDIPITQDPLVFRTYLGIYPMQTHSGMHGNLNVSGDAVASMSLSAGASTGLVGRTYWLVAIAQSGPGYPELSSVAVPLEITL